MLTLRSLIIGLGALGAMADAKRMLADTATGQSSSASPYVVNAHANVNIAAILTVGDSVNDKPDAATPYRMVGIADGLGAFDNHDGTLQCS